LLNILIDSPGKPASIVREELDIGTAHSHRFLTRATALQRFRLLDSLIDRLEPKRTGGHVPQVPLVYGEFSALQGAAGVDGTLVLTFQERTAADDQAAIAAPLTLPLPLFKLSFNVGGAEMHQQKTP
jgi:hypothetical protein